MNKTKQDTPSDTRSDGDKFEDALRTIMSAPKEEVEAKMKEEVIQRKRSGKSEIFKIRK